MRGVRRCHTHHMSPRSGPLLGAAAYLLWGLFPLYFRLLDDSGPFEIVAHRVVWSVVFCLAATALLRRWRQLATAMHSPRLIGYLALAGLLVVGNWTVYVYAVASGNTLEAALGYFINPLVSALLGVMVLGERLRAAQWVAFGIGAAAVVVLTTAYGQFPWIAIALALLFGVYGLLKKQISGQVGVLEGLTVETAAILPVAAGYLVVLQMAGTATVNVGSPYGALVSLTGPVTAIPLLLFAAAAARVSLTTIGILQYIGPSLQFLIGWLVFHEPIPAARWAGFVIVWIAVVIFAFDAARAAARSRPPRLGDRSQRGGR